MKKHSIGIILATSLLVSTTINANPQLGVGIDQGFGVSAQFDNINVFIGNDGFSADYLFEQGSFNKDIPFNWYVGAGIFIDNDEGYGVRVPLGLKLYFAKKWNAYAHISPELDFDKDNHHNNHDNDNIKFGLSGAMGVRYSF
jgi:hypothetical protein